ncbi:MAG: SDR family NAD(P)-dependent oxidoreductase [Hoeflea sp.]|uniref:SDR family NAD(P)-dependent oxidoreductase n=1 Tax=Hoeflea sp. TaxID=1940281 RepID=UPI001D2DC3DB|nr:SDR family NAD(P)-dependent oxidoreductase [Hoeflea sp.]MBU4529127.1 SDR family NAD(P)-dependent oxidoreductase [Alphaproteobacteria bacterium]MBU4543532.1 SDR family NAD(P)-dependent oxidoreductase [Alphaproteobacteria bacterium]MBU4549157.1 SDR family NAD(P)-dependent oxidoreductase [Alphaproteobacteria bacterium]MBV1725292.1 SDR family NAD(P)-dependent oxidoreductase [Hoeflea sp.]MBV1785253.1 SDR family NAD(P)-dependent oxidoreductase [Hoeflea sp.]
MIGASKQALVTGGSAGLGAAVVRWLAAGGYDIVMLDRDQPRSEVKFVDFLQCDLASRTALDRSVPELIAGGPYDVVVLNAGISATGRFEAMSAQDHIDVLRVNTEAPMVIAARLLEAGALNPGAVMVFVSSLSHFTGYPGAATYAASKDALAVYAGSLRKVATSKSVTITVAFPGPLRTDHAEIHAPEGADASKRMDPNLAAGLIMSDALSGRKNSIPGRNNRLAAAAGRMMPKPMTALMRRLIYVRLKR